MTDLRDRDTLLQQARDLRMGGYIIEALATLARLESQHPDFSRLHQERGHCHILLGKAPEAIAALCEAVRLNPALPASWDMLARLYRRQGRQAEATAAAQHLAVLEQLPPEVVVASSLHGDGDPENAETVIRDYLRRDGGNVGALRLLARICADRGGFAEAGTLLASVLDSAPDYHAARFDYAGVLLQQQKHQAARQEAERLLRQDAGNRDYLKLYGAASIGLGDYEPLIDLYARLLEDRLQAGQAQSDMEIADLWLWRANALKITGRGPEAIADYHASIAARPASGVPWFALANLKTYRFSEAEIARMRAVESGPGLQDMDRVYLCFALGKALEDNRDYAASWSYYARGNALRRASSRYRPEVAQACANRLKQVLTAGFFAERADWGADDRSPGASGPIFVLGLPRSGSTLIEQILASHSEVEGTQELTQIGRYASEICGQDPDCGLPLHPEALLRLTRVDARRLGQRFLDETRAYRRLGRPFFIDKMPNNFWHIGLIRLILPQARIIDIRREPMSCCFSNFKQLFGMINQEFSYDADHLAHHYRTYLDLMRHWDEALPGRILRMHYEDLVDDLDGGVRRMLAHCRLDYEPACVDFHKTARSVRTPSSEQVRLPLYRDGVEQWKHFEPWLGPLRDALGDAVTRYRS